MEELNLFTTHRQLTTMGSSSDVKYAWPSTVNVANFVTVKPYLEGDERSNFKIWKEQMLCLLESQDVLGFVDGEILPPDTDEQKVWRRTDRLVKGWILGSVGKDALDAVWEKQTARDVWLELDNIFNEEEKGKDDSNKGMLMNELVRSMASEALLNEAPAVVRPRAPRVKRAAAAEQKEDSNNEGDKFYEEYEIEYEIWNIESHSSLLKVGAAAAEEKEDSNNEVKLMSSEAVRKEASVLLGAAAAEEKEDSNNIGAAAEKIEDSNTEGSRDYSRYLALYRAAQRGDWDTALKFFEDVKELSTTIISSESETALHIAVLTGKANDFVNKLVELTARDALAIKDCVGDTALHNAAVVGNTEAAMALVDKNPGLLYILNKRNRLPVLQAVINCQEETLNYLISKYDPNAENNNPFKGQLGIDLLNAIIASEYLDIAFDLVKKYPDLARLKDGRGRCALSTIALTNYLFPRTETFSWCQNFIYDRIPVKKSKREAAHTKSVAGDIENLTCDGAAHNNYSTLFQIISRVGQKVESMIWNVIQRLVPKVKELKDKKATHERAKELVEYLCQEIVTLPEQEASTMFKNSIIWAAKYGISEIVEMILHNYPGVAFDVDDMTGKNVFHLAASNRFENVINLIYNMSDRKYMIFDCTDNQGNNLMHLCGKLAPPDRLNLVAGAALQMQRELQWFKEMENFLNPSRRSWLNKKMQTPQMIFTKEHEKLKTDGERWMKDTANACTIAAALIATVMFAAAFTVPGGLESASGKPLFSGQPAFDLFAVSDAISLFTSITSLLMFLSILTSRYAEQDFLHVLPKRLTVGLVSLFVSITFMMVAFSATLYLVFRRDVAWFVVLLATFACFPVTSFVLLQSRLFVDVISSTYGSGIFGKKTDRFLLY